MKKKSAAIIFSVFLFHMLGYFFFGDISSAADEIAEITEITLEVPVPFSAEGDPGRFLSSASGTLYHDVQCCFDISLAARALVDVNCYPLFNHNKYPIFGRAAFL